MLTTKELIKHYSKKNRIKYLNSKNIDFLLKFIYSNFGNFSEEINVFDVKNCDNDSEFYMLLRKYYIPKTNKQILEYQDKIYETNLDKKVSLVKNISRTITNKKIKILDVGTENSAILDLYENSIPKCSAYGLNIEDGFNHYNPKLFSEDIQSGKILIYDGYNFPFDDNEFDLVTIFSVIHHVENLELFIRNLSKITRYVYIKDNDMYDDTTMSLVEIQHDLYEGVLCPQNFSELYKTTKKNLINLMTKYNFSIFDHKYKFGYTNPYNILFMKNN